MEITGDSAQFERDMGEIQSFLIDAEKRYRLGDPISVDVDRSFDLFDSNRVFNTKSGCEDRLCVMENHYLSEVRIDESFTTDAGNSFKLLLIYHPWVGRITLNITGEDDGFYGVVVINKEHVVESDRNPFQYDKELISRSVETIENGCRLIRRFMDELLENFE